MDNNETITSNEFEPVSPDAPDFVHGIIKKPYYKKEEASIEVPFTPFNHSTTEIPVDPNLAVFGKVGGANPPKEEPSFLQTAGSQFAHINDTWHLLHAGYTQADRLWSLKGIDKDPNFNPMNYSDKFINIAPEYQGYLLEAESESDINFRLKRIYSEQKNQDNIKNGSWLAYLFGGALGLGTDLTNYIPIISGLKYAKYGKTLISTLSRTVPGALAYGGISSAAEQLDSINGNMKDFAIDSLTRTAFATVLFGSGTVLSLAGDKSVLWKLKDYAADRMKGIDYRLKINEKGEVKGVQAFDATNGGLSADKVKLAQDKADSEFFKGGLFKIPYIGTAAEKVLSNSFLGSSTLQMLNSPFKIVRSVIDLAYDHGIITQGLSEGKKRPETFYFLMNKTAALIREQQGQFNAMHMQRNGVDLKNYVAQNAVKAGMYLRQKTMETIGAELGDRPYISVEQFGQEVEEVLRTKVSSEHAAVNDAASMFRESMDKHFSDWRKAYNLPDDWMPPRTALGYLMRVYDTHFLNNNENLWVNVVSNYLRDADTAIINRMQPIKDIETNIENAIAKKEQLNEMVNVPDNVHKEAAEEIEALKAQKKALEENLQNEIRSNPELQLHAEDWNALSADEAEQLTALTKKRDIAQKEVNERKEIVAKLKKETAQREGAAIKSKTSKTAKGNLRKTAIGEDALKDEQAKLAEVQKELDEENARLQSLAHSGKINRRFYSQKPDSAIYIFRNPNERLKLRKTYNEQKGFSVSEEEAHDFRKEHAKAYYDTILNQTAEDTINQVMGRFTGNGMENHTKERTLMIPDEILYQNNFMTKDLLAKVANYQTWLARRTHLKNVYKGLSLEGGFEPIIKEAHEEYEARRLTANTDKEKIIEKLKDEKLSGSEKADLEKALKQVDLELNKISKEFNKAKDQLNFVYQKMAAINKLTKTQKAIVASIKSINAMANLGFLPIAMLTDLSANGLKHGLLPFIQSGIYPTVQSLGTLVKTKESESLRHAAGAANLSLHHIGNTYASRNYELSTNPYVNLGKIPNALAHVTHMASNFNFTTALDNFLQRFTAGIAQSEIVRMMHSFKEGKLSKSDKMWLNRYGLSPEEDAEKIIAAFTKDGGGKNSLGGYQSNYWHWQDLESANKVSDAVFRATHDTIISANALDSPRWLDENGPLNIAAPIIRGFKGWAFASLNRYVIPTLQAPDVQKLTGVAIMVASGALVSPLRRIAKGQDPYPANMTEGQIAAEILQDSPWFSYFSENLNDANLIAGGHLLGKLKNNKYQDRARAGALGPTAGNINKLLNFMDALVQGDMNEHDALQMAGMIPFANSTWTWDLSQNIVKSFGLPKNRSR